MEGLRKIDCQTWSSLQPVEAPVRRRRRATNSKSNFLLALCLCLAACVGLLMFEAAVPYLCLLWPGVCSTSGGPPKDISGRPAGSIKAEYLGDTVTLLHLRAGEREYDWFQVSNTRAVYSEHNKP